MASLKLKSGSPVKVELGFVKIDGSCVSLYETKTMTGPPRLVLAYNLIPGEIVRRGEEDNYSVEY
jgi:hypothetical protein